MRSSGDARLFGDTAADGFATFDETYAAAVVRCVVEGRGALRHLRP
jgi:hypothetical protein